MTSLGTREKTRDVGPVFALHRIYLNRDSETLKNLETLRFLQRQPTFIDIKCVNALQNTSSDPSNT